MTSQSRRPDAFHDEFSDEEITDLLRHVISTINDGEEVRPDQERRIQRAVRVRRRAPHLRSVQPRRADRPD